MDRRTRQRQHDLLVDPALLDSAADGPSSSARSAPRQEQATSQPGLAPTNDAATGPSHHGESVHDEGGTMSDGAQPLASTSALPDDLAATTTTTGKRKRSLKEKYTCTICDPPVDFATSAKKASHSQVVHQASVRVTSDTGLYFYVRRNDHGVFKCPRISCSHATPNTVSFGLHVRHTCRQPWPATAPDPPEADLPRTVAEEEEGGKRKRGGGRGKGAMRRGKDKERAAESPSREGVTASPSASPAPVFLPSDLVDALRAAFSRLEVDDTAPLVHTLQALEAERARCQEVIDAARAQISGYAGGLGLPENVWRAGEALRNVSMGWELEFVRTHVLGLLSSSSSSPTASSSHRPPELNRVAALLLKLLPFGAPGTSVSSHAHLRGELLESMARVERGKAPLGVSALPSRPVDLVKATLLASAQTILSAAQLVAVSSNRQASPPPVLPPYPNTAPGVSLAKHVLPALRPPALVHQSFSSAPYQHTLTVPSAVDQHTLGGPSSFAPLPSAVRNAHYASPLPSGPAPPPPSAPAVQDLEGSGQSRVRELYELAERMAADAGSAGMSPVGVGSERLLDGTERGPRA